MRSFLLATRNPHKTHELAELLGPEFTVSDLTARRDLPSAEESGRTFEENAALKAATISGRVGGYVVADDSGLEVDCLGGAPGVLSARYAGEQASDEENVSKLLNDLTRRSVAGEAAAQFTCVLALGEKGEILRVFRGVVRGVVILGRRGKQGFGYDPVFKPDGSELTFAEMEPAAKNAISHRARAVEQLRGFLQRH